MTATGSGSYAGGLIGISSATTGITNVYNSGLVSVTSSAVGGALVGDVSAGTATATNTYWDNTINGALAAVGAGTLTQGGSGLQGYEGESTATLLTSAGYYTGSGGWTIGTISGSTWYQVSGSTRPILESEYTTDIVNAHELQLMNLNLAAVTRRAANVMR